MKLIKVCPICGAKLKVYIPGIQCQRGAARPPRYMLRGKNNTDTERANYWRRKARKYKTALQKIARLFDGDK